jgi:hypothetical protein
LATNSGTIKDVASVVGEVAKAGATSVGAVNQIVDLVKTVKQAKAQAKAQAAAAHEPNGLPKGGFLPLIPLAAAAYAMNKNLQIPDLMKAVKQAQAAAAHEPNGLPKGGFLPLIPLAAAYAMNKNAQVPDVLKTALNQKSIDILNNLITKAPGATGAGFKTLNGRGLYLTR